MWKTVDRWKVLDRCLAALLAVATLCLAYSAWESADTARQSADTARQSAESASESAAATRDIAEIVQGVADSAAQSVETTREWFELSQRPFVYPQTPRLALVDPSSRQVRAVLQLEDVANVPAIVQKVCTWQNRTLLDYDRRQYDDVTVRETSIVFGPVHYNVNFPAIVAPQSGQAVRMNISLVYTFARDGSDAPYTWRMDAVAAFAVADDGDVSLQVAPTLVRREDEERC